MMNVAAGTVPLLSSAAIAVVPSLPVLAPVDSCGAAQSDN